MMAIRHVKNVSLAVASVLLMSGCSTTLESEPARSITASYAPVIDALGRYKAARGSYPVKLEQLTPDFLPTLPTAQAGAPHVGYSSDGQVYHLEFGVNGRGITWCAYWSTTNSWGCSGYL